MTQIPFFVPYTFSANGIKFLEFLEGFRSKAYQCSADEWTIGIGTTQCLNGTLVQEGDVISKEDAVEIASIQISERYGKAVNQLVHAPITQFQFDALVSFTYNLGPENLASSTLLKLINNNPNDRQIEHEFSRWIFAAGRASKGLQNRRMFEWELYFNARMPAGVIPVYLKSLN
jgi:lysozyme